MLLPALDWTMQPEIQIDLETPKGYWAVLVSGERMGTYSVLCTLSITWQHTLQDFLDEKLGIV